MCWSVDPNYFGGEDKTVLRCFVLLQMGRRLGLYNAGTTHGNTMFSRPSQSKEHATTACVTAGAGEKKGDVATLGTKREVKTSIPVT
jgi:hypothetical protein